MRRKTYTQSIPLKHSISCTIRLIRYREIVKLTIEQTTQTLTKILAHRVYSDVLIIIIYIQKQLGHRNENNVCFATSVALAVSVFVVVAIILVMHSIGSVLTSNHRHHIRRQRHTCTPIHALRITTTKKRILVSCIHFRTRLNCLPDSINYENQELWPIRVWYWLAKTVVHNTHLTKSTKSKGTLSRKELKPTRAILLLVFSKILCTYYTRNRCRLNFRSWFDSAHCVCHSSAILRPNALLQIICNTNKVWNYIELARGVHVWSNKSNLGPIPALSFLYILLAIRYSIARVIESERERKGEREWEREIERVRERRRWRDELRVGLCVYTIYTLCFCLLAYYLCLCLRHMCVYCAIIFLYICT